MKPVPKPVPEDTIRRLRNYYENTRGDTLYDCAVAIGLKPTPPYKNAPPEEAEKLVNFMVATGRVRYVTKNGAFRAEFAF